MAAVQASGREHQGTATHSEALALTKSPPLSPPADRVLARRSRHSLGGLGREEAGRRQGQVKARHHHSFISNHLSASVIRNGCMHTLIHGLYLDSSVTHPSHRIKSATFIN